MSAKFYTNIDLKLNRLQNVSVENATSDPGAGSTTLGHFYLNTSTNRVRINIGSSNTPNWVAIPYSTSIVASDFASQGTGNRVLASPSGGGTPTFRQIVIGDIDTSTASASGGVRLNNIGAPDAAVSFNSQNITNVAALTTTGDVTVGGNLNVTGNINEVTVDNLKITDKTINAAVGATTSSQADGAGFIVGTYTNSPSMLWNNTSGKWVFNKPIAISSADTGSAANKYSAQFQNTTGSNAISHNLGTSYVTVQIYSSTAPSANTGSPSELIYADVAITSPNQVTITMPTDSLYYFVVVTG